MVSYGYSCLTMDIHIRTDSRTFGVWSCFLPLCLFLKHFSLIWPIIGNACFTLTICMSGCSGNKFGIPGGEEAGQKWVKMIEQSSEHTCCWYWCVWFGASVKDSRHPETLVCGGLNCGSWHPIRVIQWTQLWAPIPNKHVWVDSVLWIRCFFGSDKSLPGWFVVDQLTWGRSAVA